MPRQRQFLAFFTVLLFVVPFLSCGSQHSADELYVLVSTNIQVPYWKAAGAGLSQAASQLKVRYEFVGPDEYDPKAEKEAFDKALTKKPTGILISASLVGSRCRAFWCVRTAITPGRASASPGSTAWISPLATVAWTTAP